MHYGRLRVIFRGLHRHFDRLLLSDLESDSKQGCQLHRHLPETEVMLNAMHGRILVQAMLV